MGLTEDVVLAHGGKRLTTKQTLGYAYYEAGNEDAIPRSAGVGRRAAFMDYVTAYIQGVR
jgi:hypothetical protein